MWSEAGEASGSEWISSAHRSLRGPESSHLCETSVCDSSKTGASSRTVKFGTSGAICVFAGEDSMRTDSRGWWSEIRSWEKVSGKAGEAEWQPGSSDRRRSGDGWLAVCPPGLMCWGRWKVTEELAVWLWVTSACRGWNESEPGNTEEGQTHVRLCSLTGPDRA